MARSEIDPQLPYIQVHRSSALKAASLGALLGVTPQHARGAVLGFWENLSDRRTLRAGLERPDGPAIVLSHEEAEGQLLLAFGTKVEPRVMVLAGFLEPLPEGGKYRVRGMSRQLDTEAKRLRATGWTRPQPHLSPTSAPAEVAPSPADVRRETKEVRLETEDLRVAAAANPISAMGGTALPPEAQRELADRRRVPRDFQKPEAEVETWTADDFLQWTRWLLQSNGFVPSGERPLGFSAWYSTALMTPGVRVRDLLDGFKAFGRDKHWEAEGFPLRAFISQWTDFVNKGKARAAG